MAKKKRKSHPTNSDAQIAREYAFKHPRVDAKEIAEALTAEYGRKFSWQTANNAIKTIRELNPTKRLSVSEEVEAVLRYYEAHPESGEQTVAFQLMKQTGHMFTMNRVKEIWAKGQPQKIPKPVQEQPANDGEAYQLAIRLVAAVGIEKAKSILEELELISS